MPSVLNAVPMGVSLALCVLWVRFGLARVRVFARVEEVDMVCGVVGLQEDQQWSTQGRFAGRRDRRKGRHQAV